MPNILSDSEIRKKFAYSKTETTFLVRERGKTVTDETSSNLTKTLSNKPRSVATTRGDKRRIGGGYV